MSKHYQHYSYKLNQVKNGTQEELEEYVMSFIPKIKRIISKLDIDEKYYDDLVQAGLLGVVEAIRRYNNNQTPFNTFLDMCIIYKIKETAESLSYFSWFGECRNLSELIELLNSDSYCKSQDSSLNNQDINIDRPTRERNSFNIESINYCEDESDDYEITTDEVDYQYTTYYVDERETEKEALELVDFEKAITYLSLIDERTQFIIIHSLGLFGNTPKTLEEIGALLNITRSRTSQIYNKGIRRLKLLYHKPDYYMSEWKLIRCQK